MFEQMKTTDLWIIPKDMKTPMNIFQKQQAYPIKLPKQYLLFDTKVR